MHQEQTIQQEKIIVIGAGPCGIAAAIELKKLGLQPLIIEKASIVHSIYQYPTYMQFFSSAEKLEIGGVPFTTPQDKPTRIEALTYYRKVAQKHELRIHQYEEVTAVIPDNDQFIIETKPMNKNPRTYRTERVVIATGYFDNPNMLGIPGEELPKVSHFFREAHPYSGTKTVIIGGNNSAIDAALELVRTGAEVTVVYRGADYSENIKPWVLPTFRSLVENGEIRMMFSSQVKEIHPDHVLITTPEGEISLPNDFVLALTGFRPDRKFLERTGVEVDTESDRPIFNPETMETNVKGLYVAGVVASGRNANEIFIESGRFHGNLIANHIRSVLNI